jgi:hypothetical protein
MWNRSVMVTGTSAPTRRIPTAPEATITPFFTTTAAKAGRP